VMGQSHCLPGVDHSQSGASARSRECRKRITGVLQPALDWFSQT
jgi:hypothetical protein